MTLLPETMRAFVLMGHGGFEQLQYKTDWPTPQPASGEVLIRVHACGLNNTDVNTRTAWYSKGVEENTTGGAFEGAGDEDATWGGAPLTFHRDSAYLDMDPSDVITVWIALDDLEPAEDVALGVVDRLAVLHRQDLRELLGAGAARVEAQGPAHGGRIGGAPRASEAPSI